MPATKVIRVDNVTDHGLSRVYIGSGQATGAESVEEAIEGLAYDHGPLLNATVQDVTGPIAAIIGDRAEYRYAPDGEVRFVEVTKRQVFAVYRGTLRPSKG
jgi:hypothetical protein